jgi:DNA-binding XRE family transcriptional regulator
MNLKVERLNRGLGIPDAAAAIGIPDHVLRYAEKGEGQPRPETAKLIADFYGVRVTDIWPVNGEPDEAAA